MDDLRVIFCVTCMKREPQLIPAMALNVCLWWSLRKYWRLVIVTFREDDMLQRDLCELLAVPIASGNVVLASGGTAGEHIARLELPTDRPHWMPRLPGYQPKDYCESKETGMPMLRFWHASVAKNSSHMAAMYAFPNPNNLLVNLDCDQIVPWDYVNGALHAFAKGRAVPGFLFKCLNVDGPLTGRLGYRQKDFLEMQGYDEVEDLPSAGQDLDIRDRCALMATAHEQPRNRALGEISGEELCGCALPNDFQNTNRAHDRGFAKILNCDPAVMKQYGENPNKQWSNMSTQGVAYWKGQKDQKVILRNSTVRHKKAAIGSWWVLTARNVHVQDAVREGLPGSASVLLAVTSEEDDELEDLPASRAEPPMSTVPRDFAAAGVSVEVLVVGAAELSYKFKTQLSCLGRSVNHVGVSHPWCRRWCVGIVIVSSTM